MILSGLFDLQGLEADPAWGLGLGVTVFLVSAAISWAGLHLWGSTHDRLRQPVDLAYTGLAEQAVQALQRLQSELELILPDMSDPFDPAKVVVDPSRVEKPAKLGIKILRQRQKIVSRFKLLLVVCTLIKWVSICFAGAVAVATITYFIVFQSGSWIVVIFIAVLTALMGVALVAVYGALNGRIQAAIEASDPIALPSVGNPN